MTTATKKRKSKKSRTCRVSQVRTRNVVERAVRSWNEIFLRQSEFSSNATKCSDLAKDVKFFLQNCPSDDESERMAFQSIKKLLPSSCRCMERQLIDKVADSLQQPPRVLPKGYLHFARTEAKKFFYKGWDRSYPSHCLTTTPPIKSCIEQPSSAGGSLALEGDYIKYLDIVQGLSELEEERVEAELMVIQSAGKPRPLTKFSAEQLMIKPLHKAMYDRISGAPWLLRGNVTPELLTRAGFEEKRGLLTSGDYASATDNLSIEVAEVILQAAEENAVFVPKSVWARAHATLRPLAYYAEGPPCNRTRVFELDVTNGQMMGSYLSFPLLCFQNFLGFSWARSKARIGRLPLLINGDDILFQSDIDFSSRWMNVVSELGLEVEKSKTSVSSTFGTINSTLLVWHNSRLVEKKTLRFGMLRACETPLSLGRSFEQFLVNDPDIRWRAAKVFFRWHLDQIRGTRLCLDELGFRGTLPLRMATIFKKEFFDETIILPPKAPCPHNVRLPPKTVSFVERGVLSDEIRQVNSYMMASWKWSHRYESVSTAIQYCLAMSRVRSPPDTLSRIRRAYRKGSQCDPVEISMRGRKRRMRRPVDVSGEMIFNELLTTQEFDHLPNYDEVMGEQQFTQDLDLRSDSKKWEARRR